MTRLRSLIKEVLSQPKKKDCGCGCNDCGGKAPILTEGKFKPLISEGLQHHIDKKISLFESVYRIGSEKHLELIREARALWIRGIIEVSDDDKGLLETHLGHFGLYEGVEVPLDLPMLNEEKDRAKEIMRDLFGLDFEFDYTYKPEGDRIIIHPEGYNPDGTLFDMKDVHKEKIIGTFQDKMPKAHAQPNMGGGITVNLKESLNEEVDKEGFSDKIIISIIKSEEVSRLSKVLNSNNIPFKTEKLGKVTMFKFKSYDDVDKVEALISRNRIDIDESLNEGQDKWVVYDTKTKKRLPNAGKIYKDKKSAQAFADKQENAKVASDTFYFDKIQKSSLDEAMVDYDFSKEELIRVIKQLKRGASTEVGMIKAFEKALGRELTDDEIRGFKLNEAKKKAKSKKKDPPLNKPKRGGSKAYYVYVRDPKTKKIKKVSFGSGGLRAKIKNKEARNAFAARHNCKNKKDRTKAGYWSCNLPRYAEQLGLGSKMNTFW